MVDGRGGRDTLNVILKFYIRDMWEKPMFCRRIGSKTVRYSWFSWAKITRNSFQTFTFESDNMCACRRVQNALPTRSVDFGTIDWNLFICFASVEVGHGQHCAQHYGSCHSARHGRAGTQGKDKGRRGQNFLVGRVPFETLHEVRTVCDEQNQLHGPKLLLKQRPLLELSHLYTILFPF